MVSMKPAAVLALLSLLSFLNFYAAYSPEWSRRYVRLIPFKSNSARSNLHVILGTLLLLGVLLLLWAFINPMPNP
jgi:hypothetical protein